MSATRTLVFLISLSAGTFLAAQTDTGAQGLVKYVQEARTAGLTDAQIQRYAEGAGWSPTVVKSAMAQVSQTNAPPSNVAASANRENKSAEPGEAEKPSATEAPGGTPAAKPAASPAPETAAPSPGSVPPAKPPVGSEETTAPKAPAVPPAVKDRGVPADYEIGSGDVLHISVWKEPDASVQGTVVRPDGKISMPLVKEVQVLGMTPPQAEKVITDELSKFITAPDVTVVVSAINSKKIYVTGGVKKEGPIPYTYRMTVLQAISEAGGLTDYAKKKKIYVLHSENGRQFALPFDYSAVLKGQRTESNVILTPGDTVVVPH